MKTIRSLAILVAAAWGSVMGQSGNPLALRATFPSPYVESAGGKAYLHLLLSAPHLVRADRRPVNLAVVLDRSGSMGSERKIEYAREAICTLIDGLQREDLLSVVIYDDVVDVLVESGRVTDKAALKRLIRTISPRGSTNLGGGMAEGILQAEHRCRQDYINRVVLLSDGLANTGMTDPEQLSCIASNARREGISLTTMGVGLEYNENLMTALAESGGGNYYFIESPRSLAHIMQREFSSMTHLCARDVTIELKLGHGVHLRDVIGSPWRQEGGRNLISIGDVYSDEEREFTVELDVPAGSGEASVVQGGLAYQPIEGTGKSDGAFNASLKYTADTKVVEKSRDMKTQSRVDIALSTRQVDRAMKEMDAGKTENAVQMLNAAAASLKAAPSAQAGGATGAAVQDQISRLSSFESQAKDSAGDSRKAKKAIQFENYQTQKNRK